MHIYLAKVGKTELTLDLTPPSIFTPAKAALQGL